MNTSLTVKSLIGIGVGGGIIGGSAYALMPSNTKNVIAEKLTKEKYTILTSDESNKSKWDEIIGSYKLDSTPETLKFADFTGKENDAVARLQEICSELLKPSKDETLNQDNYKKAGKWCVEPVSISEILRKRGIIALNMSTQDKATNKDKWNLKITEHRKTDSAIKKLSNLSIGENGAVTDNHIDSIKNECKKIGDQKNHQDKYQETLENFKNWCSDTQIIK